ncbi:hypothetical protein [uncultured Mucilaginibacter sp.]|uniref:hypothetical protein n=1 Tax=uncultured Mucilaginibacter sp. TaxID=797541 RepID=UPI0025DCF1F8|nr:hypothetical protein [uncultured Mucilaginibacter sp.]
MLPEEVYKRRHWGTPESFFLITANYVTVAIATDFFAMCNPISIYFWITLAVLAFYNFYQLRREREMYDKARTIGYCISLVGLVLMFFLFRAGAHNC